MRRGAIIVIAALLALVLAAAAALFYLHGKRADIRITQAQLREQLATGFPMERTALLLLRWTLSNPDIQFQPGRQRIALGLDAHLNARLDGQRADLGGRIEVETALRYDAGRGAFFLVDPVITRLAIDGIPQAQVMRVQNSLRSLRAEAFAQYPVYTLRRDDVAQGAARLVLRDVRIEDDAIVARIGF